MKKICFVTAAPMTLRAFMRNHLLNLSARYAVSAVADFTADDLTGEWLPGVQLVPIPIARPISPRADLRALLALAHHFRAEHFDVVHSITPKAGLLAMSAARLAGVPHRIHCFTGQVWATRRGVARSLLKSADRLIAANATHILTDSYPQRAFLESEGVLREGQADVLGHGSIAGVDPERFHPDKDVRKKIRTELGVPQEACLLLFVGRLNRDKGVLDLAQAFVRLARDNNEVWLAMVGPDEAGISAQFEALCGDAMARVRRIDYTPNPEHYMAAADVFVLPSYREGFNNVVIEAAACGVPAIASRIYGLIDAVVDGVTGMLHPAGDVALLHDCLARLCRDRALRTRMGEMARARVTTDFSMASVTAALLAYYEKILSSKTLS
ncbi:MAG: glycosyltransferase [Thiobacillus sp.]|nr:glycosyltransferase [Thiobacillus sp.]